MLCAPLRAVHVIGAYLHLAAPEDDDAAARNLDEAAPRDLLQAAMPGTPVHLYRVLDRFGAVVGPADLYVRAARVASGPFAEVLFRSARPVDAVWLRYLDELSNADQVVRRMPVKVLEDVSATEALLTIIAFLRSYTSDVDGTFADLPPSAGLAGIIRRVMCMLSAVEAPAPLPRALPPGLSQVTHVAGLREVGQRLRLCVGGATYGGADHWIKLAEGRSVYVVMEDPVALIELRRIGMDRWLLAEVRRERNRPMLPAAQRALIAGLVGAGWQLVGADPAEALVTLETRVDRQFEAWDRSFGELLADVDEECA
jgi:hypothetical protein